MSLMSSLYKMGSALDVARMGLNITAHNTANSDTQGYSRQRMIQSDSFYSTIGTNAFGKLKVGMGVDVDAIQQLRNTLLDNNYRQESSKAQYYVAKENTVSELETILGEINGETLWGTMDDLRTSIDSLTSHPDGMETRKAFLQNAVSFINKANDIYKGMIEYQYNIDDQIRTAVKDINMISSEIERYNTLISKYETSGDNANDYRDQRNLLLDELSTYGNIRIDEDKSGRVSVVFEGHSLIQNGAVNKIGLQYESGANGQSFVKPVWTSQPDKILPFDEIPAPQPLYSKTKLQNTNEASKSDVGMLRGLLVSRGISSANKDTPDADTDGFIIPTVQKELDILVGSIVSMMNNIVNPDGDKPYDLHNNQGNAANGNNELIFVTKDGSNNFTSGNIEVNPELLKDEGKLALSSDGSAGDTTLVKKMLDEWKDKDGEFSPICSAVGHSQNFETYYAELIGRLGTVGLEATNMVDYQSIQLNRIQNNREMISGVSLDEEMTNMIKYQHAYNGAAKVVSVIDGMLDTIINRM